jgi:hypothetical protein
MTLLTNLGKLVIKDGQVYYIDKAADIELRCMQVLPYTNPNDFISVLMNDNNYIQLVMIGSETYVIEITPDDALCYIIPRNQLLQIIHSMQGDINE